MLGKKDQKVVTWLIDSITETLNDSVNPTESYYVSLEIIKSISNLISVDSNLKEFGLAEKLLSLFSQILEGLNVEKFNYEYFLNCLNSLGVVAENFSKNKQIYESLSTLDTIVQKLLKLVVNSYDKLTEATENKYEIILRISFIFKIYGSR